MERDLPDLVVNFAGEMASVLGFLILLPVLLAWTIPNADSAQERRSVGRRAVAEFEPADGVFVAWDESIANVQAAIVAAMPEGVIVILPQDGDTESVKALLYDHDADESRVTLWKEDTDSPWIRDFGPVTVETDTGEFAFVDTLYWSNREHDDRVPRCLAMGLGMRLLESRLVLDGGNFLNNGEGFCVTSSTILLDNPHLSKEGAMAALKEDFGCSTVVILEPLEREETGHVDIFAKFIDPHTLLVGEYVDGMDPTNEAILDENVALLMHVASEAGRALKIVRIPLGSNDDGNFRSCLNALLFNNIFVFPVYSDEIRSYLSKEAFDTLRSVLAPGMSLIPVDVTELHGLGGAVHCLTLTFTATRKTQR